MISESEIVNEKEWGFTQISHYQDLKDLKDLGRKISKNEQPDMRVNEKLIEFQIKTFHDYKKYSIFSFKCCDYWWKEDLIGIQVLPLPKDTKNVLSCRQNNNILKWKGPVDCLWFTLIHWLIDCIYHSKMSYCEKNLIL